MGRAGRDPNMNAHAILMVEKSMFELQRISRRKKKPGGQVPLKELVQREGSEEESDGDKQTGDECDQGGEQSSEEADVDGDVAEESNEEGSGEEGAQEGVEGSGDDEDVSESEEEEEEGCDENPPPGYKWRKKADNDLRRWIVAKRCHQDFSDEYFNNPPRTKRKS